MRVCHSVFVPAGCLRDGRGAEVGAWRRDAEGRPGRVSSTGGELGWVHTSALA